MADEEQQLEEANGNGGTRGGSGGTEDLDAAMREAVAAVEEVERKRAGKRSSPAADSGAQGEDSEDSELERLRQEVTSLKDISMRTLADFDNYRKRVERERADQKRYALSEPLREFLPVVDNLERALAADARLEDLRVGLEMVHRQMHELLARFGARPVMAVGEPFNPNVHEAVSRVEDPEVGVPTVRDEMQKGYMLHERLLRPAMVTVAMPPAPAAQEASEAPEDRPED